MQLFTAPVVYRDRRCFLNNKKKTYMKKFWRISLVVLLSVAVGAGVSSAVYSYKITNADLPVSYVDTYGSATDNEYGFHNTALAGQSRAVGSAPDLIPAAESSVHAVVHIKVV